MSKWNGAKWITRKRRLSTYRRDNFRCVYCHRTERLTLDHLRPRSIGGDNADKNIVTACKSCNSARGDMPWWKFADDKAIRRIKIYRRRSVKKYFSWADHVIDQHDSWTEALKWAKENYCDV